MHAISTNEFTRLNKLSSLWYQWCCHHCNAWWRHQMEIFSALLAICAENSPVTGEFPAQRPVTRSFDVFFDLRLNKRLSKQWWGWWFETLSHPLWRHRNGRSKQMYLQMPFQYHFETILNHHIFLALPQNLYFHFNEIIFCFLLQSILVIIFWVGG